MLETPATPALIPSNIPGLDHVLRGGFLPGGFYLFQGDPGSGKTTLGLQYLRGRVAAQERCLYVTLTESLRDLQATCRSHGWSLDGITVCDLTRSTANLAAESEASVFHPADTELGDIIRTVLAAVEEVRPAHVLLDGLSELRLLSGDALRYRRQLLSLKEFFAVRGTTVLVLDDSTSPLDVQPGTLVGGAVVLERHLPAYGRARRRLFVAKVRGADFRGGYHDYEIVTGGVTVHPRLVAAEHQGSEARGICSSGLPNLDAMLGGGLAFGSTTLLLGPAGVGKSTVSMQFALAALARGHRAAVYVFDEVLPTFIERSEKVCLGKPGGVTSFVSDGVLHLQQLDPAEMSPGAFAHQVRRAVEAGASVVVIDSLNGYVAAMPEERSLTTHLHELFAFLNQKGVLTIVVVAQHGMVMALGATGDLDVSYLADSVLLFRYFEANAEIQQALNVFKKRTGSHERSIRQLRIDGRGIAVGPPLREFRGIMTGVPQYREASALLAGDDPSGWDPVR